MKQLEINRSSPTRLTLEGVYVGFPSREAGEGERGGQAQAAEKPREITREQEGEAS